jgi:hypothetical protein
MTLTKFQSTGVDMKKIILLSLIIIIYSCTPSSLIVNDDFRNDLGTENLRIAANLLDEEFNYNIESLTYEYYLLYLSENEVYSAKGLADKITKAEDYFFKAKKNAFLLVLYYKNEKCIIGDISSTSFIDTIYWYMKNEIVPSIKEFANNIKF